MSSKITENLAPLVLQKAADGVSVRGLSDWLQAEHKVSLSAAAISRWLKKRREERADIAKSVAREALSKTVVSDIDRLEVIRRQVAKKASKLDAIYVTEWVKLKELEVRIIDRKLHYAGADEPTDAATQTLAGLFAELERR